MCKLDLKDTYFCVPLKRESRKYVRFQWVGTLYKFLCLVLSWFSPSNIYQNLEGTNFPLKKASDSCDNISGQHVTMSQTQEELLMSRDTIIFLRLN